MRLPADWTLHLATEAGRIVATSVETADGRFVPVTEGIVRAKLETTVSRPGVRTPIP